MKSMMFCLLGAAAGTIGLMAFDTAALSRSDAVRDAGTSTSSLPASQVAASQTAAQPTAAEAGVTSDGRKVRVVYPAR
jgi:hypothetical protein